MFETETMAELHIRQGLLTQALEMYRRLADSATDDEARARRLQRVAELEAMRASVPAAPPLARAPVAATPPPTAPLPLPGVRAEWDRRHATIFWRLPADTTAPALELLLIMRTPAGIITERRTLPLAAAEGRTALPVPDLYAVRVAAGRLDGGRFVVMVRG